MANKSQSGITDWTNEPETLYFQSGTKKKKSGKKIPQYEIYDPGKGPTNAPESTAPGSMTSGNGSGPGGGVGGTSAGSGSTNPGGYDPTANVSPTKTTTVGGYQSDVQLQEANAAKGTLAASFGNAALPGMGDDPYSVFNEYFQQKGLPGDSNAMARSLQLWDPTQKMYGMMGTKGFSSDIEAVNFGQALLDQMSVGHGSQLDGISMVKVAMSALAEEFKHPGMGKGGAPTNKLGLIASDPDPRSQLNSIKGIIEGILSGTMPDDSVAGFMDQIMRAASAFVSSYNREGDISKTNNGNNNIAMAIMKFLDSAF
jgi:hypothetical protein